jgi:hypothetical protein
MHQEVVAMKRLLAVVMGLAVLVLAAGLSATPTMANDEDNDFTDRSLEGSWGFSAHGVALEDDEVFHIVVVGLFSFDGEGECSLSFTGNFSGESFPGTAEECTYEVDSDGTGTITLTFSFEGEEDEVTLAFVLVDEADEFHFIDIDDVLSGVAHRQ